MLISLLSLIDYLVLSAAVFGLVFLPGFLLAKIVLRPEIFSGLAKTDSKVGFYLKRFLPFILAPALGIVLVDVLMMVLSRLEIKFTQANLFFFSTGVGLTFGLIYYFWSNGKRKEVPQRNREEGGFWLILSSVWILSVLIRSFFYLPDVLPQDTDLGHHMYFSQSIVLEGKIPEYDTAEVIVGEHLIFAFLSIVSGVELLSALPLTLLSAINLLTLLGISLLAFVVTRQKKVALATMFFFGAYYAVDPPQGRYVSGGVVGNILGNYFICLIFLLLACFWIFWKNHLGTKNLKEKLPSALTVFPGLILILTVGSLYTHHLTSFLLLINLAFFLLLWIGFSLIKVNFDFNYLFGKIFDFLKFLFKSPFFGVVLLFALALPIFVYLPFYLENNAVSTVARAPLKESHLGITWDSLPGKFGFLKLVFALGGIWVLIKDFRKTKTILILSWFMPLFLLSFFPQWFVISLPSRRVATYLIFPLTLLAALGLVWFWDRLRLRVKGKYLILMATILIGFLIFDGSKDFRSVYSSKNQFQKTVELFEASKYLAGMTSPEAVMLKDHSTLSGDTWIKFFLQRGYDYFISRTYDYKYKTSDPYNPVDQCPREMIIVPESEVAENCYGQTRTNYVILKPEGDDFLFWKAKNFDAVYLSDSIAVFKNNSF